MNRTYFLLVVACVAFQTSFVQAQNCDYEPSKEVAKLVEKAQSPKKYDTPDDRIRFAKQALDLDGECLPCLFVLGEQEYLKAEKSGASYEVASGYLESLAEKCPEYHVNVYYYLGAIAYQDRIYDKALEYFEKFTHFPSDDPSKIGADYNDNYLAVSGALPQIKAYNQLYNGNKGFDLKIKKVQGISTKEDEYLPLLSPDGEIMFFTRYSVVPNPNSRTPLEKEEFNWSRRKSENDLFDEGSPLPPPFNVNGSFGGASVSLDNKELIIARTNPNKMNAKNFDLYSTRFQRVQKEDGSYEYVWSELVNLGPNINTPDGWEAQPTLSGDGKILIFTAVRKECMGVRGGFSHDLFISHRQSDGTWGPCKPLPKNINTEGDEKGGYIHPDSHTFYFSSNGRSIGAGGLDFYYAKMNPDGTFSDIKNLGKPINDENDQVGLVVSTDGELAYFGANKYMGEKSYDIFQFQLPTAVRPEKIAIVKGEAKTVGGNPAANASVTLNYSESKNEEEVKVNEDDGTYAAVVRMTGKEDIVLKVEGEDIAFNAKLIAKKEEPITGKVLKVDVETPIVEANKPILLNDIYYAVSSSKINEESLWILEQFAEYLQEHPGWLIEIRGHTDNVGDEKANETLSLQRANEVMNFLSSKGVPEKQMTAKGYGESKPVATNDTEAGRAKNRRTEFVIKKL